MKKTGSMVAVALLLAGSTVVLAQAAPAPSSRPAAVPALQVVKDPATVCMMNDRVMGVPQIPLVVDAKTYYGCCAMCKERLANDASARTAVDPMTGRSVDKARAVIAQRPDGSVLYFESTTTLRRYRARAARS